MAIRTAVGMLATCLLASPALAVDCRRNPDQTVTCTRQGYAAIANEGVYLAELASRTTATSERLSRELHEALERTKALEAESTLTLPYVAGAAGVGVLLGLIVGVLLSHV